MASSRRIFGLPHWVGVGAVAFAVVVAYEKFGKGKIHL